MKQIHILHSVFISTLVFFNQAQICNSVTFDGLFFCFIFFALTADLSQLSSNFSVFSCFWVLSGNEEIWDPFILQSTGAVKNVSLVYGSHTCVLLSSWVSVSPFILLVHVFIWFPEIQSGSCYDGLVTGSRVRFLQPPQSVSRWQKHLLVSVESPQYGKVWVCVYLCVCVCVCMCVYVCVCVCVCTRTCTYGLVCLLFVSNMCLWFRLNRCLIIMYVSQLMCVKLNMH